MATARGEAEAASLADRSAMRGETAICSLCDERRATASRRRRRASGELSYSDDDDWVFDFFRFGTESVLGFFFLFFLVQSLY